MSRVPEFIEENSLSTRYESLEKTLSTINKRKDIIEFFCFKGVSEAISVNRSNEAFDSKNLQACYALICNLTMAKKIIKFKVDDTLLSAFFQSKIGDNIHPVLEGGKLEASL